jgi:hypothetical protein
MSPRPVTSSVGKPPVHTPRELGSRGNTGRAATVEKVSVTKLLQPTKHTTVAATTIAHSAADATTAAGALCHIH